MEQRLRLLHGVVLVWSGAEDAKTASSIVQRHVHSAQHRLICIDPQRSSERPLPPSAWPSNKLGQRGVFAIKWTVLLNHKTPIIRASLSTLRRNEIPAKPRFSWVFLVAVGK